MSLHSSAYFGDQRDFWWNRDFLELMAERWRLDDVRSVLDVGCGVGHWGRCLMPLLPSDATITGLDREAEWIRQAQEKSPADEKHRWQFEVGNANALPYEDDRFDMVTCQTLLIHVEHPKKVLLEMLRVTKPGGIIVAAEPNNRTVISSSLDILHNEFPLNDTLNFFRLLMTCERGKQALGMGNISAGDIIPGLLAQTGAIDVQVYISDKASAVVPPYTSTEQQALVAYALEAASNGSFMGWDRTDTERYFLAGGGIEADFKTIWEQVTNPQHASELAGAITNKTYHTAGGALMYLISGRKLE